MVNFKQKKLLSVLGYILALFLVNVAAQYFYTRFDFTKEKKFTLHPLTNSILKEVNKPITVTVYLDGEIPAAFKRLRNATADLLSDYTAYAGNNIHFEFVNPTDGLSGAALDKSTVS